MRAFEIGYLIGCKSLSKLAAAFESGRGLLILRINEPQILLLTTNNLSVLLRLAAPTVCISEQKFYLAAQQVAPFTSGYAVVVTKSIIFLISTFYFYNVCSTEYIKLHNIINYLCLLFDCRADTSTPFFLITMQYRYPSRYICGSVPDLGFATSVISRLVSIQGKGLRSPLFTTLHIYWRNIGSFANIK